MKGAGSIKGKKYALSAVSLFSILALVRPISLQDTAFLSYWDAGPDQVMPEKGVLLTDVHRGLVC